jgi:hypothetical protein
MRRRASAGVTTRVPNPSGAVTRTLPRNESTGAPTAASTASWTDSSIARARSATLRPISVNSQPTAPRSISRTPRIFSRARIRRETVVWSTPRSRAAERRVPLRAMACRHLSDGAASHVRAPGSLQPSCLLACPLRLPSPVQRRTIAPRTDKGVQQNRRRRARIDRYPSASPNQPHYRSGARRRPRGRTEVAFTYSGPWAKTESRNEATRVIWSSRFASQADSRCSLRRHAAHFACPTAP